jgi:predicted membrane channel-forming protein YqfA (hemolysin III family)
VRILSDNDDRKQSIGEEIANGVSHGVALIAAWLVLPSLLPMRRYTEVQR